MFISLNDILKNELFSSAKILAGQGGLSREVRRVSVFDCPCRPDLTERGILQEGDLFITCLDQFKYETENIYDYMEALIQSGSSGLLVVTDDMLPVLTEEVRALCTEANLPVVLVPDETSYASIIDTVNKYIAIDNFHSLNMLKLEKIMYGNISQKEIMETLYSMNPGIKPYIRVICVKGEFNSDIAKQEMHFYYLNRENDLYVRNEHSMVFLLSEEDPKALRHHTDAAAVRLSEFIDHPVVGYSRIRERRDVAAALEEGRSAMETAAAMEITSQTYDPMSVLQLLLAVRDSQEARDFYEAYVNAVARQVSAENLQETLRTMEAYVAGSGNFSKTAEVMNQHENTIRYRVNKVKSALNMENDNIRFHETIAVAVKLRTVLHERL